MNIPKQNKNLKSDRKAFYSKLRKELDSLKLSLHERSETATTKSTYFQPERDSIKPMLEDTHHDEKARKTSQKANQKDHKLRNLEIRLAKLNNKLKNLQCANDLYIENALYEANHTLQRKNPLPMHNLSIINKGKQTLEDCYDAFTFRATAEKLSDKEFCTNSRLKQLIDILIDAKWNLALLTRDNSHRLKQGNKEVVLEKGIHLDLFIDRSPRKTRSFDSSRPFKYFARRCINRLKTDKVISERGLDRKAVKCFDIVKEVNVLIEPIVDTYNESSNSSISKKDTIFSKYISPRRRHNDKKNTNKPIQHNQESNSIETDIKSSKQKLNSFENKGNQIQLDIIPEAIRDLYTLKTPQSKLKQATKTKPSQRVLNLNPTTELNSKPLPDQSLPTAFKTQSEKQPSQKPIKAVSFSQEPIFIHYDQTDYISKYKLRDSKGNKIKKNKALFIMNTLKAITPQKPKSSKSPVSKEAPSYLFRNRKAKKGAKVAFNRSFSKSRECLFNSTSPFFDTSIIQNRVHSAEKPCWKFIRNPLAFYNLEITPISQIAKTLEELNCYKADCLDFQRLKSGERILSNAFISHRNHSLLKRLYKNRSFSSLRKRRLLRSVSKEEKTNRLTSIPECH